MELTDEIINKSLGKALGNKYVIALLNYRMGCFDTVVHELVSQACEKAQAFDIINKKHVNLKILETCKSVDDYNDYICSNDFKPYDDFALTIEEFDILKETRDLKNIDVIEVK